MVVLELDLSMGHPFAGVLSQLPCEDSLIEVVLKLLIGDIDAQLLKAVRLEAFKPIDVQDTNFVALRSPDICADDLI